MKRITWVDFGKGFTIFFVLAVHCIDELYATNLFPNYAFLSKLLMAIIYTFIMPCFFALSGFLYKSPNSINTYFKSIRKKFINFSIPYVVFSFVYVALQHLTTVNKLNSWSSLLYIYKQPISYLWFLYVLFFIFILIGIFDLLKIPFHGQIIISIILFMLVQILHPIYVITATCSWLPCFYIGIILKRNTALLSKKATFYISSLITSFGLIWRFTQGENWFRNNDMSMETAIFKISSIFLFFVFFYAMENNSFFNYFDKYGKFSMVIYMVHLPFTSFFKIISMKVGIPNYFLFLFITISLSWLASIFICYLSRKFDIINFFFHPAKYLKLQK